MSLNPRENLILGGFICISFGAFFTVAGVYTLASTVGVLGILLFIVGMSLKSNIGMSDAEVRSWRPEEGQLPDAGRVMYRVDVTIDEPIESTIVSTKFIVFKDSLLGKGIRQSRNKVFACASDVPLGVRFSN